MRSRMYLAAILTSASVILGGTLGCDDDAPKSAGESVERAGDKIENATEKAGDKIENAAEKAGDKTEAAAEKVKDKSQETADKARDAVR